MQKINLKVLADKWPSGIVARSAIREFTGGTISPGTMANLDSDNQGPEGGFYLGRQKVYPVDSLIAWLESRADALTRKPITKRV